MSDRLGHENLTPLLQTLDLRAKLLFSGGFCEHWALNTSGRGTATFHLVTKGQGWLHRPGGPSPIRLTPGDLVVFPHDSEHLVSHAHDALPESSTLEDAVQFADADTAMLCGEFDFSDSRGHLLLQALPAQIVVRADVTGGRIAALVKLLAAEASMPGGGNPAALERLADALFVYLVEHVVENGPLTPGVLYGLRDPALRCALSAIHREPGKRWTLKDLAAMARLSRSAFVSRFSSAVGIPPVAYLARWRMQLARRWLSRDKLTVGQAAGRCGYESEAAFAKAFKRITGIPPGTVRRMGARYA